MSQFPILIDTNTMDIEEVDGHPGALRQILLSDDEAGLIQIVYGPPGFTGKIRELLEGGTHRHVHRTVNERHYILGGDYPVWHWPSPSAPGTLTRVRRHYYLENPPMTLHGITPDATSETGWKILQWTTGPGTELYQPGADVETIEVGFDEAPADNEPYQSPILVAAITHPWRPHTTRPGWQSKLLSPRKGDRANVSLVNVPPGASAGSLLSSSEDTNRKWLFIVSGDLRVKLAKGSISGAELSEGVFLAWTAEQAPDFPAGPISEGGAVVLCVGHDLQP